jgi:16S rRNA (guanine527-N7)-methyltransferase
VKPVDALRDGARSILGRPLSPTEESLFDKYLDLLIKWQRVRRLVGSAEPTWIVRNLFLDSLLFLHALSESSLEILDLGSGAGVPGLPLKIVNSQMKVTLVESRQRRVSFLRAAVRELGIADTTIANVRLSAKSIPQELRSRFDAVVMRCAGDPAQMLPVARKLLHSGGMVVVSGPPRISETRTDPWRDVSVVFAGETRHFLVAGPSG